MRFAYTAAVYLLATVAIDEGRFGQAFPAFGAERRGGRSSISRAPILLRCQVIRRPAILIIQDQTLLHSPGCYRRVAGRRTRAGELGQGQ